MALDKLVDSTQLNSDLTSVANAIRAKSGGSSQLAFPAGFVSEIQAIPSGGGYGSEWTSDKLAISFKDSAVDDDILVDARDKVLNAYELVRAVKPKSAGNVYSLTVYASTLSNTGFLAHSATAFNDVSLWTDDDYITLGLGMFVGSTVTNIGGTPFYIGNNLTSDSYYNAFQRNSKIEDVRFYENSSDQTILFYWSAALSNATLISLANALKASEGSASLKLHATPKARLVSILGTVESVTRGAETYDRFAADANGIVTLQDFITTTKGWTLA